MYNQYITVETFCINIYIYILNLFIVYLYIYLIICLFVYLLIVLENTANIFI